MNIKNNKTNKEKIKPRQKDNWFGFDIKKYVSGWQPVALVIALGMIFLLAPQVIRTGSNNPNLIGDTPYFDMRIAENMSFKGVIMKDDAIEGGRSVLLNPYYALLALLGKIMPIELLLRILPLIFGLLTLLVFYLILEKLGLDPVMKIVILFLAVLSPLFVAIFSIASKYSMILFLMCLVFYFFISEKKLSSILAIILMLPLVFFGAFESFMIICMISIYSLMTGKKKKWTIFSIAIILILSISFNIYIQHMLRTAGGPGFMKTPIIQRTFSDFGGETGVGFFNMLLALIGIVILWKRHDESSWLIFLMILIIASIVFINYKNIAYIGFLSAYFSAIGLISLMRRRWHVETLKYLTAVTLLSGLLFSTVSYISSISESEPNTETMLALSWMKTLPKGTVLSHHSNGFWIEYKSGKKAMVDSYFSYDPYIKNRNEIAQNIFASRNLKETIKMMGENDIRYIFIDREMKEGKVWIREDEGLLFLIDNSETFKKIYSVSGIEIYIVLPEGKEVNDAHI